MKAIVSVLASVATLLMSTAARADCPLVPVGDEKFCVSIVFPSDPTSVELGGAVPIPFQVANYTDFDLTFYIDVAAPTVPGMSGNPFNGTVAPQTLASHTDVVLQTDDSMPLGIHDVNIGWTASGHIAEDGSITTVTIEHPFELVIVLPGQLREIIQLPVRWCVVEGTQPAEGKQPGETVTGARLLSLLRTMNNEIWLPQAGILFRHASALGGIPVIADPKPTSPNDASVKLGDLAIQTSEYEDAVFACEQAWSERYPDQRGIILVMGRVIVGGGEGIVGGAANAVPLALRVASSTAGTGKRGDDLCGHPRKLLVADVTPLLNLVVYDESRYSTTLRTCLISRFLRA